ncbi:MAG: polysaccharide pyruvyl transferase family protein, partial [Clostridia bacterium]|nr:polysaccharide pyruvyl transferase family protein [Clostridia bacterium]
TYCISNDPQRHDLQYQLGRPDRYLYKFYENDIKKGIITKSEAQELLDCLCIQVNNRVRHGMSSGFMVGGRDKDGVVANDLTYMCLDSIENIRLVYPSVGLCFNKDMPDALLERACEILSEGCSHPAIFNDDIIAEGLKLYGVPEEDCHSYIHSTCVEITPIAASNVWVADPYTNTVALLFDVLDREYADFEELKKALLEHFAERIKNNFEHMNNARIYRSENSMFPLVSCFVKDCLAKGKDIDAGGARYNWIMPSFVGMANLTDSLYAIKTIIFDNKEMSIAELKKIIDSKVMKSGKNFKRRSFAFSKFASENFNLTRLCNDLSDAEEIGKKYDACVCGSDQIWNPVHTDCNPYYFLQFIPAEKRIAYAPSIACEDIPEKYMEDFKKYISSFASVSVRESSGAELVEKITGKKCENTVDPTLLFDKNFWNEFAFAERLVEEPYVFCYFLGGAEIHKKAIERIEKVLGKNILQIICIDDSPSIMVPVLIMSPSFVSLSKTIRAPVFVSEKYLQLSITAVIVSEDFWPSSSPENLKILNFPSFARPTLSRVLLSSG